MSALKKIRPLTRQLEAKDAEPKNDAVEPSNPAGKAATQKAIIFRVTAAHHKQLKHLATDKDTSVQKLLERAVDLMLAQEGLQKE